MKPDEVTSIAQQKMLSLRSEGYEICAVVLERDDGKCCIVSGMGRVTWHPASFADYITGRAPIQDCSQPTEARHDRL